MEQDNKTNKIIKADTITMNMNQNINTSHQIKYYPPDLNLITTICNIYLRSINKE